MNTFRISKKVATDAMGYLHTCRALLLSEDYVGHYSHLVADTLKKVSPLIGGHGVDGFLFEDNVQNGGLCYVNIGDPYQTTIIWRDEDSSFSLSQWGDELEAWEAANSQQAEDEATYQNEIQLR